jgi:hypothetical protein
MRPANDFKPLPPRSAPLGRFARIGPMRTASAVAALAAMAVTFATTGCGDTTADDQTRTLIPLPTTATTTAEAATAEIGRRSLRIIPFTAEFSREWQITSGSNGTTVVEAKSADAGDFDIFVLSKDGTTTQLMNLMLADASEAASKPAVAPTTAALSAHASETQRLLSIDGAKGVEYTQTDSQGLVTVRARLFVPTNASDSAAAVQVYEVSVSSLSPEQLKKASPMIRSIIDSLKYDASALRTGN